MSSNSNSCVKAKTMMEEVLKTYQQIPVPPDDDFYSALDSIRSQLSSMNISCIRGFKPEYFELVKLLTDIMLMFKKNDKTDSTNNNFIHYIKLSRLSAKIKNIIILKKKLDIFIRTDDDAMKNVTNYEIEQYVCDVYKSKIETFKSIYNEEIVKKVIESFSIFLIDYVKFLSRLNNEAPLNENIDLLLEVADKKILLRDFHIISTVFTKTIKIDLMEQLADLCISGNCDLKNSGFVKSKHINCKLEASIICYFIIKRICKYLELQSMHRSSKILSMFTIENIFLIEDCTPNAEFESLYEESVKLITFNSVKEANVLPKDKIEKCLDSLQIIVSSFSNQLQNCPFVVVFLSMLSEIVMAVDSDKDNIICLVTLIIDYLDIVKLPSSFQAVSYMFEIYQKLKHDTELEFITKHLCRMISNNLCEPNNELTNCLKDDLKRVINNDSNWTDKSIIVSYVLMDVDVSSMVKDKTLHNSLYTLNENILLSTQYASPNTLLIYPYSFSLYMSIMMKNEDCLFNNLAILENYLTILFGINLQAIDDVDIVLGNQIRHNEYDYFFKTTLRQYNHIFQILPSDFFVKCWQYILNPKIMNNNYTKKILHLCSPANLIQIIDILKSKTVEMVDKQESFESEYYSFINELWSILLKIQFTGNQKKRIRRDHVNHFCFTLNKTYIFNTRKICNDNGLILLIQLICSLLKLSWINKPMLMDFSLRILTYVEKRSTYTECDLLKEAAELLIILYKCPNKGIKPLLGLFVITFTNFLKKCWTFIIISTTTDAEVPIRQLYLPLHKLELCSSLFKKNKKDFDIISQYFIEILINMMAIQTPLKDIFMRLINKIIFNLMDICTAEDMKHILYNVKGSSLMFFESILKDYQAMRFTGRL